VSVGVWRWEGGCGGKEGVGEGGRGGGPSCWYSLVTDNSSAGNKKKRRKMKEAGIPPSLPPSLPPGL